VTGIPKDYLEDVAFFAELGINCSLGISSAEENPDDFVAVLTPTEKSRCGTFEDRMHIIS